MTAEAPTGMVRIAGRARRSPEVLIWVALFAGTLGAVLARMFTNPLLMTIDDWNYTVWGQEIVSGRRPAVAYILTAPKPLAYLLAVLVAPFAPGWGFAVVIALFSAWLVLAVGVATYQRVGWLGVPVALAAMTFSLGLRFYSQNGALDVVPAALVVTALTVRGRWRVGLMIAAGLVRPEVWILAAFVGYLEASGSRVRRVVVGALVGTIAPAIWALTDIAANGRPFMFLVVAGRAGSFGSPRADLRAAPDLLYQALSSDIGVPAIVLGTAGLVLVAVRERRGGAFDPLPLLTAALIALGVLAEMWQGLPAYPRYTATIGALLAVGTGWLVGSLLPRSRRVAIGEAAVAVSIAMIVVMMMFHPIHYIYQSQPANVEDTLPAIERARVCGTIGLVGPVQRENPVASMLAALGRLPLTAFSPAADVSRRTGAALAIRWLRHGRSHQALMPTSITTGQRWVHYPTTAGQLWLSEACLRRGGGPANASGTRASG